MEEMHIKLNQISINESQHICLDLLKTKKEEISRIKPENLHKLTFKFIISQIFEPSNAVNEIRVIDKNTITFKDNLISFAFALEDLPFPERCQIEIDALFFMLKDGKRIEASIQEAFSFLELQTDPDTEDSLDIQPVINSLYNDGLVEKFEHNKKSIKEKLKTIPISKNFETFELIEDAIEVFKEFELKSSNIKDVEVQDLEYSLREKILECLFLSISHLISLKIIEDVEVKQITARLIQKYYGPYLS